MKKVNLAINLGSDRPTEFLHQSDQEYIHNFLTRLFSLHAQQHQGNDAAKAKQIARILRKIKVSSQPEIEDGDFDFLLTMLHEVKIFGEWEIFADITEQVEKAKYGDTSEKK